MSKHQKHKKIAASKRPKNSASSARLAGEAETRLRAFPSASANQPSPSADNASGDQAASRELPSGGLSVPDRNRGRSWLMFSLCIAAVVVLFGIAGLSKGGRTQLARVISIVAGGRLSQGPGASRHAVTASATADVGQQAAAAAGWSSNIHNSVTSGSISYFDRTGASTGQLAIKLYMKYPDEGRIEIDHGGGNADILGFDGNAAWSSANGTLTPVQARDIRAWLRTRPERMFAQRAASAPYREAGTVVADHAPATPWQVAQDFRSDSAPHLAQVEINDEMNANINVAGNQAPWSDRRSNYYYVRLDNFLIGSVEWMEPDDPTLDPDSLKTPKTAVEVDYGNYQQSGGVRWPFDIVHWFGGKVDYRITVTSVQVNQNLSDSLFQHP